MKKFAAAFVACTAFSSTSSDQLALAANSLMKTQDESLTDPTERLKMLRKEEEEAAKMEAFYKADEAETKYVGYLPFTPDGNCLHNSILQVTKEYPRGLLGRAKSFVHGKPYQCSFRYA
ncbi:hypothetical protein BESB_072190 [Besnoitia besnoiti]|uniref:Uncharacterized protein n=1 Tax=Besnoitia besnoiti TaxID=94643 RepID=A0A2A9MEL0_BESBE|nr:uncharacterized protein BESB_072190 [Besnoitia besnoiti]PFH34067.1 hypothetical protein BESB_072190 [Besnoitia besnoiti]